MGFDMSEWPAERRTLTPPSRFVCKLWSYILEPRLRDIVKKGSLRVVFNDGRETLFGERTGPEVELIVHSESFIFHCIADLHAALADAYVNGKISVKPDVVDLLHLLEVNQGLKKSSQHLVPWLPVQLLGALGKACYAALLAGFTKIGTASKGHSVGREDLPHAMFEKFLGANMTYSSGLFDDEVENSRNSQAQVDCLELAQQKTMNRILDLIDLQGGDSVLEIGCGLGSMAIWAGQRCNGLRRWTGITHSQQQQELASKRVAAAGLADKVQIVLCDYSDAAAYFGTGAFSKVVSIEMVGAVEHDNLPKYFGAIHQCLQPGGKAAIQAVCFPPEQHTHELPLRGFHVVSLDEVDHACKKGCTGLVRCNESYSFGLSYAKTLREWRRRLTMHEREARDEACNLGRNFDGVFYQDLHYYLACREAVFQAGHADICHLCFQKQSDSIAA